MRMTFFHLCRRCTTQQKGSSFLLTKDIASRYGLWSILKLEALNCVAWFFLRVRAAARTCSSFGTFEWWNIALARLLLVCRHLKKDLIWAFTRLMNSLSFWARWAFLYPLVVVPLLIVSDCADAPFTTTNRCWMQGMTWLVLSTWKRIQMARLFWEHDALPDRWAPFLEPVGGSTWSTGAASVRFCSVFLFYAIFNLFFNWMQITCDLFFQHWEGEGCSEETQGPIKEASSV